MEAKDVQTRVLKIIESQLDANIPEGGITLETTFEELEVDSFAIVEIIFSLEEEFDIDISDNDVQEFTTVGSFVNQFTEHLNSRVAS
jgi:acyl carrier protein